MIALARAGEAYSGDSSVVDLIVDGLFTTITNVNFDTASVQRLTEKVREAKEALGGGKAMGIEALFGHASKDIQALKSTLLFGLRGMAAYAHHARALGKRSAEVDQWFLKGMAVLDEEHGLEEWLALLMEFGHKNLACMALLDEANTSAYGNPVPTQVPMLVEKGPFIVVSGHDLYDRAAGANRRQCVNIYTHGEIGPRLSRS